MLKLFCGLIYAILIANAIIGVECTSFKDILESITSEEGVVSHGDTLAFTVDVSDAGNSKLPKSDDVKLRIFNPDGDHTLCEATLFKHVDLGHFPCNFHEADAHFKFGENILQLEVYNEKTKEVYLTQDLAPMHRFDHHIIDGYYDNFVPEFEQGKNTFEVVLVSLMTAGLQQGIQGYVDKSIPYHTKLLLKSLLKIPVTLLGLMNAVPRAVTVSLRAINKSILRPLVTIKAVLITQTGSLVGNLRKFLLTMNFGIHRYLRRSLAVVGVYTGDGDDTAGGKGKGKPSSGAGGRKPRGSTPGNDDPAKRPTTSGSSSVRRPPGSSTTAGTGSSTSVSRSSQASQSSNMSAAKGRRTSFLGRSFRGIAALTALWAVSPAGPIGYSVVETMRERAGGISGSSIGTSKRDSKTAVASSGTVARKENAAARFFGSMFSEKCPFLRPLSMGSSSSSNNNKKATVPAPAKNPKINGKTKTQQ
jgi:hypothetical protein